MKGYFYYDILNIIDNLGFRFRLNRLNKEYRRVFHFIDALNDFKCPNSQGRCVIKYQDANVHWLNYRLHRIDNPAIEYKNGHKAWYYHNQRHRPIGEGPAIICANGTKYWYYEGKLHRPLDEGPAIIRANSDKEYWENGKFIK